MNAELAKKQEGQCSLLMELLPLTELYKAAL